ncbi:MAG: type II toxin-antitoxin system Phd/YefM family antitoxin [Chitinispirillales bacterium]|jgi:antitoxin YefM|nr:type II toxin-antitoxin system Phd/YefM family antitoxin [Chitinispirillales bacterium]
MLALRTADLHNDFGRISEIIDSGERVLIAQPQSQNLVVLSERDYNELEKAKRNAEYLEKIDRSSRQVAEGRLVVKTMEELEEMAT